MSDLDPKTSAIPPFLIRFANAHGEDAARARAKGLGSRTAATLKELDTLAGGEINMEPIALADLEKERKAQAAQRRPQ